MYLRYITGTPVARYALHAWPCGGPLALAFVDARGAARGDAAEQRAEQPVEPLLGLGQPVQLHGQYVQPLFRVRVKVNPSPNPNPNPNQGLTLTRA